LSFRGTRNHITSITSDPKPRLKAHNNNNHRALAQQLLFRGTRNHNSQPTPHSSPQRLSFRGTRNHITSITSDPKPRLKPHHNNHRAPAQQLPFRGTRNHIPQLTTTVVIPRNEESHPTAHHNSCHSEERGITPQQPPRICVAFVIPRNEESHNAYNLRP